MPTAVASYKRNIGSGSTVSVLASTAGEILVCTVIDNSAGTAASGIGVSGGPSWTRRAYRGTSNRPGLAVFTATAAGGAFTLTVSGGHTPRSAVVTRWAGGALAGSPVTAQASAMTVGISTSASGSAIQLIVADWDEHPISGTTYSTATAGTATQFYAYLSSGNFTGWHAYHQNAGAAGAKTVGLTAPTSTEMEILALEILAAGATITKTGGAAAVRTGIGSRFNQFTGTGGGAAGRVGSGAKARITLTKTGKAAAERTGTGAIARVYARTFGGAALGAGTGSGYRALRGRPGSAVGVGVGSGTRRVISFELHRGNPAPPGTELLVAPYVPPQRRGLRFIARNVIDGQVVDWDLPLVGAEITWTLSGPTVLKAAVEPENIAIIEERIDAWATWIDVEEDDLIRASCIVQPVEVDDERFTVEAIGVAGYPQGLPFMSELSEIQFDALDAVRRIWAHLLSYPDATPMNIELSQNVCGLLLGVPEYPRTDATGGMETDASGNPMLEPAKPYQINWWSDIDCGREIDQLAQMVPFDYVENPIWSPDYTYVIHRIELGYPRVGRLRTDLRFVMDENMITAVVLREQPGTYASQIIVRGAGEGRDGIRGYAGTHSARRLRRVTVVTDKAIGNQVRADARAADELRRRQSVLTVGEIVIWDWHPNAPIGSFAVGDDIVIQAPISYLGDVALTHRITAYTWSPEAGTVSIQLARSDDFYYGREPGTDNVLHLGETMEEPVADIPLTVAGNNTFARTVMVECGTSSMVVQQMWLTYGVIDGTAHFELQAYGGNGSTIGSEYAGDPFAAHGHRSVDLADHARTYMTLPSGSVMVKVTGSCSTGAHPAMGMVLSPKK